MKVSELVSTLSNCKQNLEVLINVDESADPSEELHINEITEHAGQVVLHVSDDDGEAVFDSDDED